MMAHCSDTSQSRHPIMEACALRKAFDGEEVLRDVSFCLREGEVVLLRGDNGAGKTSLLNILSGYLAADAGHLTLRLNGSLKTIIFPMSNWARLSMRGAFTPEAMRMFGIGRSWQDMRLFQTQTLRDNIALGGGDVRLETAFSAFFRRRQISAAERASRSSSDAALLRLNLMDRAASLPGAISLGECKRVAIARSIEAGAKVLLLDEPLSGLDALGARRVIDLLAQLAREHKVSIVIVEHSLNIPPLLAIADAVWTLREGRLVFNHPGDVMGEGHHDASWLLSTMQHLLGPKATATTKELGGGALLTTISVPELCSNSAAREIRVESLQVRRGSRVVIGRHGDNEPAASLTFALGDGDLGVLHAPNGWGKTTLLESLMGVTPIAEGRVYVEEQRIERLPTWIRAQLGLGFLQARARLFPNLTVTQVFELSKVQSPPPRLAHLLKRQVGTLSGGERQRVALASVMHSSSTRIPLLDEPFATLDETGTRTLIQDIAEKQFRATLIVSPAPLPLGLRD